MKKHLLLIVTVICFLPSLSKAQEIEWQNTIGGNGFDELFAIEQTNDGGYILGGRSDSGISGDKTESNVSIFFDYWIVKIDGAGVIQWQNTIGGSSLDELYSIKQTTDGGYILGGWSQSNISGDKTESSNGAMDYWILKTDASGIIQWQNTIGGSNNDYLNTINQTSDGGYILGGISESNISGDKIENSNGLFDYWIVKIDGLGIIQWQNTIGGSGSDYLYSMAQTTEGGYICGGYSGSYISGDKTENSFGFHDYWIVKVDTSGVIEWQNTIGGSDHDLLYSVVQTNDDGYILGGYSRSNISGEKTDSCNGSYDYWIIKTDSTGNIEWQNAIGGNWEDELHSIHQTSDGGYILGGNSQSVISGDKSESSNGYYDCWIVKIDDSGNILWQNTIGGNDQDYLYSIRQSTDGGFILGGTSKSILSGDKTENCNGGFDYWIVKTSDYQNIVSGKLFVDGNSNNIQDGGEPPVVNGKVTEAYTSRQCFSWQNGDYKISGLDSGSVSVSPSTLNYYIAVPAIYIAIFTGIQQTDSLNDFAFQPAGVFNDLCVVSNPIGPFRSGFDASYQITYENVGTTTLNPTVVFYFDNDLTFISATPTANTVTTDSLVWNFGPMPPYQSGSILVTVNVNIGTSIGTLINSVAVIEPIAGDANTQCNQSSWEVFNIGSMDPNDILVDQDTLLTTQFSNPPYLEYIIRFQNTGNDTAFTVKVLNAIDTNKLELSTIEFVASSHPANLSWTPWERSMQFQFDNILLPDSNVNEPESHGFIRYRIKPKSSLVLGDSINNTAAIYFDFNAPVITNTALTEVVLPTSLSEISKRDKLLLYPNPAHSTLTIVTGNLQTADFQLIISDVSGRTLISKYITGTTKEHTIDISSFSKGIYFVQLQDGENISRGRFVKE